MAAFGKTHGAGGHNFADGPLRNRLCPHNAYLLAVSVYVHGSEAIVLDKFRFSIMLPALISHPVTQTMVPRSLDRAAPRALATPHGTPPGVTNGAPRRECHRQSKGDGRCPQARINGLCDAPAAGVPALASACPARGVLSGAVFGVAIAMSVAARSWMAERQTTRVSIWFF